MNEWGLLVQKVLKDRKGPKVRQVSKGNLGPREKKVREAHRVQREIKDSKVGPQSPKGNKGDPEPEGSASGAADIDIQNNYEILPLKRNTYPIHGDLSKVISYEDQREIFLSKKEDRKMENAIDMNINTIYHVKDPDQADQATNKKYVDNEHATKLDKAADIDMKYKKNNCPGH